MKTDRLVQPVDPARLASGEWCHRRQKTIGQGDISASYSADRIGMGKPVRKPFSWNGALWVCVGKSGRADDVSAEGYRLTLARAYDGVPMTYAEKVRCGNAARADPNGFYHGMTVTHSGDEFVLSGPPVTFIRGQQEQFTLF